MELKKYQQSALADLATYMKQLSVDCDLRKAYRNFWLQKGIDVDAVAPNQFLRPYDNTICGVPRVMFKVPTAGGKTFIACNALKVIFDHLPASAFALTNIDDKNGLVMTQNSKAKICTYSLRTLADFKGSILDNSITGLQMRINGYDVFFKLCGRFNAYNLLAIYCAALELGASKDEALVGISKLESAKGRLETLRGPRKLSVILDYAHTPDALENVLATLRDIACEGRQIVAVFGCGGDRDRTKRPEMAAVAEKYADRIILTSDNSRSERTEDIIAQMKAGLSPRGLAKTLCIADRAEAIRTAIMTAPDGAAILLAGKGHETYQIIGTEHRHFDEREIVRDIFNSIEAL